MSDTGRMRWFGDSAWQSCIYSAVKRNSGIPVDNHNHLRVCVCVCVLWVKHRKYVPSILSTTTTAWHNIRLLSTIHLIRPKLYPRSRNIQHTPRLGRLIWDLSRINCAPCTGFDSMLANISSVPKCCSSISSSVTFSLSQKWRIWMCLDLSDPGPPRLISAM